MNSPAACQKPLDTIPLHAPLPNPLRFGSPHPEQNLKRPRIPTYARPQQRDFFFLDLSANVQQD